VTCVVVLESVFLQILTAAVFFLFKKKLRADESQGVLAVIQCRIFCLPVCY